MLALGNPTFTGGPFYDAFTSNRDLWAPFTISAFDTPNFEGVSLEALLNMSTEVGGPLDQNVRPYLTTRRWVREKYSEWGPGHPYWEARVMGRFPAQSEYALLSLAWLEAAIGRELKRTGKVHAGLDVAGPGEDETVLCFRDGGTVLEILAWPDAEPRGQVVAALRRYRGQLDTINVDANGIGYYMMEHLRDQGFKVEPVMAQGAPRDTEQFDNLKAELYWQLRMRVQSGDFAGISDEKTIGQLAGILWKPTPKGKTLIESKDAARARGVKSPDRAEAVMLAFAERHFAMGVIEYMKMEKAAAGEMKVTMAGGGAVKEAIATGDATERCEKCGSMAVHLMAPGQGFICAKCSHQWGANIKWKPSARGEVRKDAWSRK
jgi:hypothetical protein